MDSLRTSKIRFWDQSGRPLAKPREWSAALIELDIPVESWNEARLSIQKQPASIRLEHQLGTTRVLADWPRAGTGNYQVKLQLGESIEEIVVSVRPEKITEQSYASLIDDLESRLPASVAIGLQRLGGLSGIELKEPDENTFAQEIVQLRRAVDGVEDLRPGLAAVLRELSRDHHQILQTREFWVERRHARRPTAMGIGQALIKSGNLDKAKQPIRIIDQRVEHSVDVYENRLVRMFHHQVDLRLRAAQIVADARRDEKLIDEVNALVTKLGAARRQAHFLNDVSLPNFLPVEMTMVLIRRDAYRAAVEGYLEFNRSLMVRLDNASIESPLENLPALYQTWGTLEVMTVLLGVASGLDYRLKSQRLVEKRSGELFVRIMPDGKPCLVLESQDGATTLRLIPEFSTSKTGRYRSVSFKQKPDIVVEIDSGETSALILFDPKYKLDSEFGVEQEENGRPKKEDIDKMHAYRDAIRDTSGERIVTFAGILYPGPTMKFSEEIGALSSVPGNAAQLRTAVDEIFRRELGRPATGLHSGI